MMKLLKGAVFFIPVNHDDTTDQSDGSSQNSEISTQPVVASCSYGTPTFILYIWLQIFVISLLKGLIFSESKLS